LLALRAALERSLEEALVAAVDAPAAARGDLAPQLMTLVAADDGPSLSRHLAGSGTLDEFREFVVHRSAYHLKEADPHTWAIPRLSGGAKAALVEIQADEYGGGREEWMHSSLFARAMRALDLDGRYGAYLERIPGATLASVNVMSWFGLHRRWRGAIVGNLAVLEMTSSEPMRRYAGALRRLGLGEEATRFYDEHVEADALHEQVAAHDLAGRLAIDEPELVPDILFGAAAALELESRFAERLLGAWGAGESSLRPSMSHAEVA
jgi:Iron-containing redox enzyme